MSTLLIVVIGVLGAIIGTLLDLKPRNRRALRLGALAAPVALALTWLWPMHVFTVLGCGLALLLLWGAVEFLGWPVRILGELLQRR